MKYGDKIRETERLIGENDKVAMKIVDYALDFYSIEFSELQQFINEAESSGRSADRVSVSQALKHYVRDWAAEGELERAATFPQILSTLENHYPQRNATNSPRILVPGAGLGRLAHDIADLRGTLHDFQVAPNQWCVVTNQSSTGFEVTANEWSTYMNVAYRYITSPEASSANSSTIYPYIDWWSHQPTTAELHRPINIPVMPVDPSSVVLGEGDFTTVFNKPSDRGRFGCCGNSVLHRHSTQHSHLHRNNPPPA